MNTIHRRHWIFFSLPFYFLPLYKPLTSSEFQWFFVQASPMWTSSPYCSVEITIKCNMDLLLVRRNGTIIIQVNAWQTEIYWKLNDWFFSKKPKIQCKQLNTCKPYERSNFTVATSSRCATTLTNAKGLYIYIYICILPTLGKQFVRFMPIYESCSALRARSINERCQQA